MLAAGAEPSGEGAAGGADDGPVQLALTVGDREASAPNYASSYNLNISTNPNCILHL